LKELKELAMTFLGKERVVRMEAARRACAYGEAEAVRRLAA
jgi:hypothetical protein